MVDVSSLLILTIETIKGYYIMRYIIHSLPRVWLRMLVVCGTLTVYHFPAAAQVPASNLPPSEYADALHVLLNTSSEKDRQQAADTLVATSTWEPYLRVSLGRTVDQKQRNAVRDVLVRSQQRLVIWNLERAKQWSKELRFDYFADFASGISKPEDGIALIKLVVPMQEHIYAVYRQSEIFVEGHRPPKQSSFSPFRDFDDKRLHQQMLLRDYPLVDKNSATSPLVVLATRAYVANTPLNNSFSFVRYGWAADENFGLQVQVGVHIVNSRLALSRVSHGLVIADGDIEIATNNLGSSRSSVIIANGDIIHHEKCTFNGVRAYASGNVRSDDPFFMHVCRNGQVQCAGKIDAPNSTEPFETKYSKPGVKDNPFGVKFFSVSEVGLTVNEEKERIIFSKIDPASALAKAGFEPGDQVLEISGTPIKNVAELRRELRHTVVWGSGLFEVKRGRHSFTKLVIFAEPPKR